MGASANWTHKARGATAGMTAERRLANEYDAAERGEVRGASNQHSAASSPEVAGVADIGLRLLALSRRCRQGLIGCRWAHRSRVLSTLTAVSPKGLWCQSASIRLSLFAHSLASQSGGRLAPRSFQLGIQSRGCRHQD